MSDDLTSGAVSNGRLNARVLSVHSSSEYTFTKSDQSEITLLAGLGVENDVHSGAQVRHRSRVAADPTQPNLRQVHLIHQELFDECATAGFSVRPGQLGENITTVGLDILNLPTGTVLRVGDRALIALTGLRNPCAQINAFQDGLLSVMLGRDDTGKLTRKTGVMSVVLAGGVVRPGDPIVVALPPEPHLQMEKV
jgi:MOSC domain-containing protein YiiM